MKFRTALLSFLVLLVIIPFIPVIAEDAGVGLAKRGYCYAYQILTGNIGLFAGFCIAIFGLYTIIWKGSTILGTVMILLGASLTALPDIIETVMRELSAIVVNSGIGSHYFIVDIKQRFNGDCESIPVDMSSIIARNQAIAENAAAAQPFQYKQSGALAPVGSGPYMQGAPVNQCPPAPAKCAPGIRNNNPGNIRAINTPYVGQIGVDKNGFAIFDTMAAGYAQLEKQIGYDVNRHGAITIEAQTARYSPPTENDTNKIIETKVNYLRKNGFDVTASSPIQVNNPAFMDAYKRATTITEVGKEIKP